MNPLISFFIQLCDYLQILQGCSKYWSSSEGWDFNRLIQYFWSKEYLKHLKLSFFLTSYFSLQGYFPSVYYPKRNEKQLFKNLTTQCELMDIPFLNHLPTPQLIDQAYNFIVDALFGFSFKGDLRPPFKEVIPILKELTIPICSIDVPSGRSILGTPFKIHTLFVEDVGIIFHRGSEYFRWIKSIKQLHLKSMHPMWNIKK